MPTRISNEMLRLALVAGWFGALTVPCLATEVEHPDVAVHTGAVAGDREIPAGPRNNPEDQFRAFSLFPSRHYAELSDMGINLFQSLQSFQGFDGNTESERRATLFAILDRIQSDGNDYMERIAVQWDKDLQKKYPRIGKDGNPVPNKGNTLDASNVELRAELRRRAKKLLESLKRHPSVVGAHVCSEVRDNTRISFTPQTSNAWAKVSGGARIPDVADMRVGPHFRTIEDFPKGRIVPERYPLLEFYRWFWRKGDGWVDHFNDMVEETNNYLGGKALTFYAPAVRCPPIWRADSGNVTAEGHWTYANPLPYAINYVISEQQEMAKGHPGALVMSNVQGISYRSRTAPKGVNVANEPAWVRSRPNAIYITVPPDMAVEAFWWTFARRLDGVGLYGWRSLFDAVPAGVPAEAVNYQYTNPNTFPRIAELFKTVAVPLGPLFRAVPERPPEVAILESSAATFFAKRGSWGWDDFIFLTGIAATKANLMPQSLYDDDIKANGGIPDTIRVLLMPHCDVLTETTYRAVRQFQARGGIVLGDKSLVPGIRPEAYIDGFPFYGRSTAKAIAEGVAKAADGLIKAIEPRYRRYATADESDILLHVRTFGSADYVFAINDKRKAGDYIGQYGLCFEDGMPNKGMVTVNRATGAVYDLVRHCAVPFTSVGGKTKIPVEFTTCDGRLLLMTRAPLAPLVASRNGDEIVVTTPDIDVIIPIVMEVRGSRPHYAVVKNGFWRKSGAPPDAKIRSLADGSVAIPLVVSRPEDIERRYREWINDEIDPLVPASRPVVKTFKIALSQDPANDHDVIRVESIRINGPSFELPKKGNNAAVEVWLGVPRRDFGIKVNGQDVGYYEQITNPLGKEVRVDLTPFVKWNGKNVMTFTDSLGKDWTPAGTIEVLEVGK